MLACLLVAIRLRPIITGPFPPPGPCATVFNCCRRCSAWCTCEDTVSANRSRPCLYSDQRCSGPCGRSGGALNTTRRISSWRRCSCPVSSRKQDQRLTQAMESVRRRSWLSSRLRSIAIRSSPCIRCRKSSSLPATRGRMRMWWWRCAAPASSALIWPWCAVVGILGDRLCFRAMPGDSTAADALLAFLRQHQRLQLPRRGCWCRSRRRVRISMKHWRRWPSRRGARCRWSRRAA